ncbi:hypothetical protein [Haloferula sp.]|uniref:hypothetical protein n=1 Tax=Haloferula sp. TaxID=2497595 RepID=UPI00329CE29B
MKAALQTALVLGLLPLNAYELHEWGTFTTVSGSDGSLLAGLEREEEHLPSYVHHHPGFDQPPHLDGFPFMRGKRMPIPVANVKVKMETPVVYFHSDEAFSAKVNVGFNGGTISQWYPERSGGEQILRTDPESGKPLPFLDFAKPYSGSIEWQIDVLSPAESRKTPLYNPLDLLQWTYSRVPEANTVRTEAGTTEGFLFYRGLGSFDPGFVTRVTPDETLHLENQTGGAIPYTLVYERNADGTSRWFEAGGIDESSTTSIATSAFKSRPVGFDVELFKTLSKNLAAQGLLESEAEAMVKTWWKSYFEKPGLRVFWVLPQEKTDAILPLSVDPAPDKTVRIMVGRSEVIRHKQEREWLKMATSDNKDEVGAWSSLIHSDRFGLAYSQRIQALQAQAKK